MREQAAAIRERLHVDPTAWWQTGEDLSMLSVVQDAVARERQLAFDYVRADGQRSARTVDPLGLVAKGTIWACSCARRTWSPVSTLLRHATT
jgi:predicted DNA-binding transcriptional regulator YafY